MINYYKILGVRNFADFSEIRPAYLKLVKQHHPDLHPDHPESTAIFQYITEAYEVLSDTEKRNRYDHQLKLALFGLPGQVKEDPRKKRREMIIRMREKVLAREKYQFDQLNSRFPLKWRVVISSVILIWGVQIMYRNWFPNIKDESNVYVTGGLFVFIGGVSWCSNLYYRKQRITYIQNRIRTPYTRNSMILFFSLLIGGFLSVAGLSNWRSTYHLEHYGQIITARLNYMNDFGEANLYYTWNDKVYYAELSPSEDDLIRPSDGFVLLRISSREPRIIDFVKKENLSN